MKRVSGEEGVEHTVEITEQAGVGQNLLEQMLLALNAQNNLSTEGVLPVVPVLPDHQGCAFQYSERSVVTRPTVSQHIFPQPVASMIQSSEAAPPAQVSFILHFSNSFNLILALFEVTEANVDAVVNAAINEMPFGSSEYFHAQLTANDMTELTGQTIAMHHPQVNSFLQGLILFLEFIFCCQACRQ